jgi:hypothetical protein
MPISVGQKVHEGDKFIATVKLIARSFKECIILVDDTIQRHTLQIFEPQLTKTEAYNKAKIMGNLWLETNRKALDMFSIPIEILRWDFWAQHKFYFEKHALMENTYENDKGYRESLQQSAKEFLERNVEKYSLFEENEYERAFGLCIEYLIEECACMLLWIEKKCHFEVYPSGRNRAMEATYDKFIRTDYPEVLRSVSLRFKKQFRKSCDSKLQLSLPESVED